MAETIGRLREMLSLFDGAVKRNICLSPYAIKLLDESVRELLAFFLLKREYIFG